MINATSNAASSRASLAKEDSPLSGLGSSLTNIMLYLGKGGQSEETPRQMTSGLAKGMLSAMEKLLVNGDEGMSSKDGGQAQSAQQMTGGLPKGMLSVMEKLLDNGSASTGAKGSGGSCGTCGTSGASEAKGSDKASEASETKGGDKASGADKNTLSPTNAKGEVSSEPSDVRQLFKDLFGKMIDYVMKDEKGGGNVKGKNKDEDAEVDTKGSDKKGLDKTDTGKAGLHQSDDEFCSTDKTDTAKDKSKIDYEKDYSSDELEIDKPGTDSKKPEVDAKKPDVDSTKPEIKPDAKPAVDATATAKVDDGGKTATVELGGHKFTFNKNESQVIVDGGAKIHGDPHLTNKDGTEAAMFKKDTKVQLSDGTKMYAHVTDKDGQPWTKDTKGETFVNRIALESPDGKMAFIDNLSQKNDKPLKAEIMEAKSGNFADIAVKMADFKPKSELSLDADETTWADKEGNKLTPEKMKTAEA